MGISRSENMRRIRSRDTAPELVVRAALRQLGHVGWECELGDDTTLRRRLDEFVRR